MSRPDNFLAYGAMGVGGLIVTLCGTCTAGFGLTILPGFRDASSTEAAYAAMFLWPTLVIGSACVGAGMVVFRSGRRALGSSRPDRIDILASLATLFGLLGLVAGFVGLIIYGSGEILRQPVDRVGQSLWLAALCGLPALGAAYFAWRTLQRLLTAVKSHAG